MKCSKCGKELMQGATFCMYCGSKVGVFCPKCGTELPNQADVRFCYKCGAEVKKQSNPSQDSLSEGEKQRVADEVYRKAVLAKEKMQGLEEIKKQEEEKAKIKGEPVWDNTANGVCDCAVGECDCDGSIWR